MFESLKGPGESKKVDGSKLRIGIIHARWNTEVIEPLLEGTVKSLKKSGVKDENITIESVPGSYELPFGVQRMIGGSQVQASSSGTSGGIDLLSQGSSTDLASKIVSNQPFDAVIAIGVLLKGSTMHFEYICDSVSHGLMRVQLDTGVPVIFGVLTCLTEQQALQRAGVGADSHNHGVDWGNAAVEMGIKRNAWTEGKFNFI